MTGRRDHDAVNERASRSAPAAALLAAIALSLAPQQVPLAVARGELTAGGVATRGYFEWGATGGYAWIPTIDAWPAALDLPIRLEGLYTTRANITNLTFSLLPLVRWTIPGFAGNGFSPYLATGPGLHRQTTWSDLMEFGGVEATGNTAIKWHLLLGTSLARGKQVDLIVESRLTVPSALTLDYLQIALRIHPAAR